MSGTTLEKPAAARELTKRRLAIFPTEMGWMAIIGNAGIVDSVFIGHPSAAAVRRTLHPSAATESIAESDWCPRLRKALQDYSRGQRVDFAEFELHLPERTTFRDKVLAVTRRLAYGTTTTYGQLARDVGHPGAARAVGTVMSTNRFPILIPCHRVLAAGGKLGGYTSPAGTDLKQRLLDMERSA